MRIHIGSDHAGLELKAFLIDHLTNNGHEVTDHGPFEYDALDDYPVFCIPTAEATADDPESLGIVLGGSGNGEQMAAIKWWEFAQLLCGVTRLPVWPVNITMQM